MTYKDMVSYGLRHPVAPALSFFQRERESKRESKRERERGREREILIYLHAYVHTLFSHVLMIRVQV